MGLDSGPKDNAKAEYTEWLVAIFTSERVFPGSLFCLRVKLSSTLINSRSPLARA